MPLVKHMFDVVLYEPEIPPNTGNIMRLCANAGARLHLIEPLGFELDDRQLRRAGLDYREWASVRVHVSLGAYLQSKPAGRLYACSTRGSVPYTQPAYRSGDAFLFGLVNKSDTVARSFLGVRDKARYAKKARV